MAKNNVEKWLETQLVELKDNKEHFLLLNGDIELREKISLWFSWRDRNPEKQWEKGSMLILKYLYELCDEYFLKYPYQKFYYMTIVGNYCVKSDINFINSDISRGIHPNDHIKKYNIK